MAENKYFVIYYKSFDKPETIKIKSTLEFIENFIGCKWAKVLDTKNYIHIIRVDNVEKIEEV